MYYKSMIDIINKCNSKKSSIPDAIGHNNINI